MSLASQSWNWSDVDEKVTPRLIAYLISMTGGYVGKSEAEDLVQETYVQIIKQLNYGRQLATIEDLRRYAFRVAHNTAISYIRSKKVRREQPFPRTEDGSTLEPPDRSPCPDESFKLEKIAALRDCINKLDQKRKYTKILWADLSGKKYEQIAKEFKIASGTVGSHLDTARKKLKKCLDLKAKLAV